MTKLKFKTKIEPSDMGKFNLYVMYKKPSGIFTLIMGLVALVFAASNFVYNKPTNGFWFVVIALVFFAYFPWILVKRGKRSVELSDTFKKPLFYTLTDNGIEIDQEKNHAKVSWEDCYKAVECSGEIFLFTAPKVAFIWPVKQLGDDYEEIKNIIKTNMPPHKCKSIKVK